jgi:16S rRNA (guanine966-N2)-methyltransferase
MAAQGQIRIIAGQWKRSKIPVLSCAGLRPTPARVRETLFNWLGSDLSGWRCLDAFAGTGALGFEAASRGAQQVTLIERDAALVRSLRALLARWREVKIHLEATDALQWMARCRPDMFELIFIDPPFEANVFQAAVRAAVSVVVLGGFIYLEADRSFSAADFDDGARQLKLHRQGRAGLVHYHLFQRSI